VEPQIESGLWVEVDTRDGTETIPTDVCGFPPGVEQHGDHLEWSELPPSQRVEIINQLSPYLPCGHSDRIDSSIVWVRLRQGFGARLSSPGYLDCTPWLVFDTHKEAKDYLAETYELCEKCLGELDADYRCEECDAEG
jgi:hypothetical protein